MVRGRSPRAFFEYYPRRPRQKKILFNPSAPADVAGIAIPPQKALAILKNLGFGIRNADKHSVVNVAVPSFRTDIDYAEDIVEEVTRIYGFENIPVNEHPVFEMANDITQRRTLMIDAFRQNLCANGFDEILSIPLGETGYGATTNYRPWEPIITENAVNENYPELRQSLAQDLSGRRPNIRKRMLHSLTSLKLAGSSDGKEFHIWRMKALVCLSAGKENSTY